MQVKIDPAPWTLGRCIPSKKVKIASGLKLRLETEAYISSKVLS